VLRETTAKIVLTKHICVVYLPMDTVDTLKMDKTAFSIASLLDESDEKGYWLAKTPHERLEAMELMRQIIYGYDPSSARLQRVLAIAELTSS
jgi:hypothetical protein